MPHLTSRGARRVLLLAAAALCVATPAPGLAQQRGESDPALSQRIDADQQVVSGPAALSRGHVDVGPLFVDGRWTLMVHDGTRKEDGAPSVWRRPEQTVLQVGNAARLKVPDDPAYAFLPAKPGSFVHVVPETQNPDVVWVGWNTQDPEVMQQIDRGVTMTMTGVQGPGELVVYLQSGSFGDPDVLWDSTAGKPKPSWVDVNTHAHANWVFTKPGVYLVQIRIAADLIDGRKVSDTRQLRFAIGDQTSTQDALAATWSGPSSGAADTGARPAPEEEQGEGGITAVAVAALAVAAVALLAGFSVLARRGSRAKRRARTLAADGRSEAASADGDRTEAA